MQSAWSFLFLCENYEMGNFRFIKISENTGILHLANEIILLLTEQIANSLIRMRGCKGWFEPLLFTCVKIRVFVRRGPY